jgi:hypothetical protein
LSNVAPILGIPLFAWYPILAIGFFALMVILVPRKRIRDLFLDGLIMGAFLSWLFALLAQGMRLIRWEHLGPFSFVNCPVWLHLAWASVIIIFIYFKPQLEQPTTLWGYILAFSWLSAMFDFVLHQLGLLTYLHWSPWVRFCLAIIWFWSAIWFNTHFVQDRRVHN